jgi:hypothetical protein
MIIQVRVFPKSKKHGLSEENGVLRVHLSSAPERGKANKELVAILAEYYNIRKGRITILRGEASKNKVVEIAE